MPDSTPSRRTVLKSGASIGGLVTVGSLAGCTGLLESQSSSGKIDSVPSGSTTVLSADVAGFLNDDSVTESLNEQLDALSQSLPNSPATISDALDQVETEAGIDPRGLTELVTFAAVDSDDSAGAIAWTDWTENDIVDAVEANGPSLDESTYEGKTVYDGGSDNWIGVLEEGVFALGTERSVKRVVDTHSGSADPVGGAVRSSYEQTRDGYVRFAFEVPDELVPEESSGQFDVSVFESVQTGHGSISGSSDAAFSLTLSTDDADGAENVADVIEGGLVTLEGEIEGSSPAGPSGEALAETVIDTIDQTSVSQSGSTVSVETTSDVGDFVAIVTAVVGSFVLGLGGRQAPRAPQAAFEFEYDQSANTLRITHQGGDTISARELYVTGSGFQRASGADMTSAGQWQGSTSSQTADGPGVAAGDSVTVGVAPDHEIRIVYRSEGTSATLALYEGPDA